MFYWFSRLNFYLKFIAYSTFYPNIWTLKLSPVRSIQNKRLSTTLRGRIFFDAYFKIQGFSKIFTKKNENFLNFFSYYGLETKEMTDVNKFLTGVVDGALGKLVESNCVMVAEVCEFLGIF